MLLPRLLIDLVIYLHIDSNIYFTLGDTIHYCHYFLAQIVADLDIRVARVSFQCAPSLLKTPYFLVPQDAPG